MSNSQSNLTRFAIYARFSSDMQNEISTRSQIEQCTQAIEKRGGVLVDIFIDEATSGWSLDRPGFNELRKSAENKNFDAVMFWKFDRLSRKADDAMIIKMLLRQDLNLSLYCVEGFSEDDDDTAYSTIMEQMLAIFSAYYSKNLSSETKRGKKHRAINGYYNGSIAPLGYELVTKKHPDPFNREPGLYVVPRAAAIVRRAFRLYATGDYSDRDVADWMNTKLYIQQLRAGQKPINKGMVRDMLQNRTYTGRVPYAETFYSQTLGVGKTSPRRRKEWFEGRHQGFVSDDVFDRCQQARKQNTAIRKTQSKMRTYLLHDRVYCARCFVEKPDELNDNKYGKMIPQTQKYYNLSDYHCIKRKRGYGTCSQSKIAVSAIDTQVIDFLCNLKIPHEIRIQIENAVDSNIDHAHSLERMQEIKDIMRKMDIKLDNNFIANQQDYFKQYKDLQQQYEISLLSEQNIPITASSLLQNFKTHWDDCYLSSEPKLAQQKLVKHIVENVYVEDDKVIAIQLYGNYIVVLDENSPLVNELIRRCEN